VDIWQSPTIYTNKFWLAQVFTAADTLGADTSGAIEEASMFDAIGGWRTMEDGRSSMASRIINASVAVVEKKV
jgi:hypothetical protein